eukprot:158806-Hanusia_phi.AAC.1
MMFKAPGRAAGRSPRPERPGGDCQDGKSSHTLSTHSSHCSTSVSYPGGTSPRSEYLNQTVITVPTASDR